MSPVRLRAISEAVRVGLRQFNMVYGNSCESSLEFVTLHTAVVFFCKTCPHCKDGLLIFVGLSIRPYSRL